ncbi:hypothetical protein GCM10023197_08520 [Gordonia humi]
MLASSGFTEEGVEGIISSTNGLVTRHLAIRLDAMLKAVKLPAGIANLDTSLTDVDRNALSHFDRLNATKKQEEEEETLTKKKVEGVY